MFILMINDDDTSFRHHPNLDGDWRLMLFDGGGGGGGLESLMTGGTSKGRGNIATLYLWLPLDEQTRYQVSKQLKSVSFARGLPSIVRRFRQLPISFTDQESSVTWSTEPVHVEAASPSEYRMSKGGTFIQWLSREGNISMSMTKETCGTFLKLVSLHRWETLWLRRLEVTHDGKVAFSSAEVSELANTIHTVRNSDSKKKLFKQSFLYDVWMGFYQKRLQLYLPPYFCLLSNSHCQNPT